MNKNTSTSGLGLFDVLTIVFVVLKLVDVIDWSWWWVVSPTLIHIGLIALILIGISIWAVYDDRKYGLTLKKGKKDKWRF